jgi:hypothetical protein
LTADFEEYKLQNNLDEYFAKHLNNDTRKTTLALVADLMKTDDWYEKLQDYKESLNKFQPSESEAKLKQFYEDLMRAKDGYLSIYQKQTEQTEIDLEYKTKYEKPLPVQVFNAELEKEFGTKVSSGVVNAGKRVAGRLYKQFLRPTAEAAV